MHTAAMEPGQGTTEQREADGVPLVGAEDFQQPLELLAAIGQDFAASLDIDETLDKALRRIRQYLDAEAASLFMLEDDDRQLACRACDGPTDITGLKLPSDAGIVGRSVQENVCQMVRDVRRDPDFARAVDQDTGFTTRSILCAPMSVKERCVGAIELLNKHSGDGLFSEQDRHVLQALASSAALAVINARLTGALIEQEKVRRELELAADIQRNLLPRRGAAGLPIAGVNVPARGVSGDFYDFFERPDGRIYFCIGDVSGKGINASLLMAKTSSLFHCLGKSESGPGQLLGQINRELCETGTRGMFVTMIGGVLDPPSGRLSFANAGHEPPLLRTGDGAYRDFPAEAPPLGIAADVVPEAGYPVTEISLAGGMLAAFTDGVTEGRLPAGKALGVQGVKSLLEEHLALPPVERLAAIVDCLARPGTVLHDDITMLLIEARGSGSGAAR